MKNLSTNVLVKPWSNVVWFLNYKICVSWADSAGSSFTDIIRLVNGVDSSSGFVEIFHDGEWGRVCQDSFDRNDAEVVCRMLGYP